MKTKYLIGILCLTGILMACGDQQLGKVQTLNLNLPHLKPDVGSIEKQPDVQEIEPVEVLPMNPINLRGPENCGPRSGKAFTIDIEPEKPVLLPAAPEYNLEMLFDAIEMKPQTRIIDLEKDTTLSFEQGTTIKIPANAFVDKNGLPLLSSEVEVNVSEYYDVKDLLSSNLTTQTDDGLLETGGTIYISAESEGQKVVLKDGASIEILFPTEDKKPGMDLFKGKMVDDQVVWEASFEGYESEVVEFVSWQEAEFPGGYPRLAEYISKRLYYPSTAIENNEQGRVYLSFYVEVDGSISDVKVDRGVSKSLDKSAVWFVETMPRWTPADNGNGPVKSRVRLPINFFLDSGDARNRSQRDDDKYYKEYLENKLSDSTKSASVGDINNYILTTTNLGWINCDRFIKDSREKVDFFVRNSGSGKEEIKMIFPNQRAIMRGTVSEKGFTFQSVPEGAHVYFFGVKIENGKTYFAINEGELWPYMAGNLHYRECTLEELQNAMAQIEW